MPEVLKNDIRVIVVTTPEQFMHAMAVRSICFMADENAYSFEQAIDGNDYQATQILVYKGNEPIGSARVRWFRDFAKIERTAFRPGHRNTRNITYAARFIFEHVAKKGYEQVMTHAEPKFAVVWERILGFKRVEDKPEFTVEGHEPFVELIKTLTPADDAISVRSDARVLFRIEGEWDRSSILETDDTQARRA